MFMETDNISPSSANSSSGNDSCASVSTSLSNYSNAGRLLLAELLARKPAASNDTITSSMPFQRSPVPSDLLATLNSSPSDRSSNCKSIGRMLDWKLVNSATSCPNHQLIVSNDGRSACLHPTCSSCFQTEGVRVDTPIRANCVTTFEWHVSAHTTGGTSVMFGLCTDSSQLHSGRGYVDLLGDDESSWALSSKGRLHYRGQSWPYCAPFDDGREHTVTCSVNSLTAHVEFHVDGRAMGRAFCGLLSDHHSSSRVYACVSSTTARSIFRLGVIYERFPSLQEMCSHRTLTDPTCLWRAHNEFRLPASMIYAANSSSSSSSC